MQMEQKRQMKLLILGGSYFMGLAFAEHAFRAGHKITVLNRGSRPLESARIREFHADRRDADALKRFPDEDNRFDAVVDFCGYQAGDIQRIWEHLNASFRHYVFISTVDVLRHGTGELLREDAPYEERDFGGEAGEYIRGKIALERELIVLSGLPRRFPGAHEDAGGASVSYTILRPSFLFGPGNYAPRESVYFQWIAKAGQILYPADASGRFGMVYVEDAARAALACCENPDARGNIFHLCNPEILTYASFSALLREAAGQAFTEIPVSCAQVLEEGLPLPFPLMEEESAVCDGGRICGLGFSYTNLTAGMRETWNAYRAAIFKSAD